MGYFSNGDEGDWFDRQYCSKCIHAPNYEKLIDCPVLTLHSLWNYEQNRDETKKTSMDILIKRTANGLSNECQMFVKRKA